MQICKRQFDHATMPRMFFNFLSGLSPWRKQTPKLPQQGELVPQPQPSGGPPAATLPPQLGNEAPSGGPLRFEDWLRSGTWLAVASSNVDSLRYLWDQQTLEVVFLNQYHYGFFSVPPETADGYAGTSSPGRYHWRVIRDRYPYVRYFGGVTATVAKPKPRVIRPPTPVELATKWKGVTPVSGIVPPWAKK